MLRLQTNRRIHAALPELIRSVGTINASKTVPTPSGAISTPSAFLKSIGRSSDTKLSKDSWELFWNTGGAEMKKAGVPVRDRRYILWCMEKYRQGINIEKFAHEARPKKTVRGWGPIIQNGKVNRSGRH